MNTDAIGLMMEGRHDDALELFHDALEKAKEAFDSKKMDLEMATVTTAAQTCLYEISLDQVIYPYDCSERASPDNCFRVYRHVFAVAEMHGLTTGTVLRKTLAVVAYNMGLFYHECGLACADGYMISRALCFYNIAVTVVQNQDLVGEQDPGLVPFELALYNNLGHVHGIYSNREGASSCLGRVRETIARWGSSGDETTAFFLPRGYSSHSHLHKAPAA